MPILGDHPQEIDRTYTPLEAKRREAMHLHNVKYGFFRVAKDEVKFPICANCNKEIYGQVSNIDGRITHYYQPCA